MTRTDERAKMAQWHVYCPSTSTERNNLIYCMWPLKRIQHIHMWRMREIFAMVKRKKKLRKLHVNNETIEGLVSRPVRVQTHLFFFLDRIVKAKQKNRCLSSFGRYGGDGVHAKIIINIRYANKYTNNTSVCAINVFSSSRL